MRGLKDKVVIVTGGGGGIGTATCRRLAEEGAKVAVLDIDEPAAARVATAITDAGGTAAAYPCDITRHGDCADAVRAAEAALGPLDVLVNNAGWDIFRPFVETTLSDWDKIIAINLVRRAQHASRRPARHGRAQTRPRGQCRLRCGAGRLVGEAVYAACKAGLIGFSKTLAREHARDGITVNVVVPRHRQHQALRRLQEGRRATRTSSTRRSAAPSRSAASASRTTCTAPSASSPATTPRSSPAR